MKLYSVISWVLWSHLRSPFFIDSNHWTSFTILNKPLWALWFLAGSVIHLLAPHTHPLKSHRGMETIPSDIGHLVQSITELTPKDRRPFTLPFTHTVNWPNGCRLVEEAGAASRNVGRRRGASQLCMTELTPMVHRGGNVSALFKKEQEDYFVCNTALILSSWYDDVRSCFFLLLELEIHKTVLFFTEMTVNMLKFRHPPWVFPDGQFVGSQVDRQGHNMLDH